MLFQTALSQSFLQQLNQTSFCGAVAAVDTNQIRLTQALKGFNGNILLVY